MEKRPMAPTAANVIIEVERQKTEQIVAHARHQTYRTAIVLGLGLGLGVVGLAVLAFLAYKYFGTVA